MGFEVWGFHGFAVQGFLGAGFRFKVSGLEFHGSGFSRLGVSGSYFRGFALGVRVFMV